MKKLVESCNGCPFSLDNDGRSDQDWTCHATYDSNGWPISLGPSSPRTPPIACPLRKGAITVAMKAGR